MKKYVPEIIQHCLAICLLSLFINCAHSQWVQTDIPLAAHASCFAVNGTSLFAGTIDSGVFICINEGINWTNTGLKDKIVNALVVLATKLFAGVSDNFGNGAVLLSTNNGTDWQTTSNASTAVLCLTVHGINLFSGTGTGSGVLLSKDDGATWNSVSSGLGGATIQALAVNGSNLFAGTDQGVFLSTNNGANWKAVNKGLTTTYTYSLAIEGSNILVGTYTGGVFLSTNNGSNWNAINNGLEGYKNTSITAMVSSGGNFFVGTDSGVFLSTDNGINWIAVNTGLTNDTITVIQVINSNLYAGTRQGTWRRPLSEMISTGAVLSNEQSTMFALSQNYPNPFNDRTTISYSVSTHEHVRITISNVLGEQLQTLVDEDVDAGLHNLTINTNNLPNGMYVVTMFANGITRTQNMCVQK